MKMMKRNLALPILGGLGLILAACGGSDPAPSAPAAMPPAAAPVEEPAPVEAEEPPTDTAEAAPEATDTADTATTPASEPAAEATTGFAAYTGDATRGRRVFAQCMTCHAVQEGRNNVGPSLYGIVGREAGTIPGFRYSQANLDSDVVWTEENLFEYLENPTRYIPGTIMAFPGLRNPQDRADVIEYLKNPG